MMIKTARNGVLMLMSMLLLWSCDPEDKAEIGQPHSKVEGLNGTWKLVTANQIDGKSPIQEARDRTSFYTVDDETLVLNLDRSSMTYSVDLPSGINFFGESGTWGLDDDFVATLLHLESATETVEMQLGNVVRYFDNELILRYEKQCAADDKPYVIYEFTFARQ